MLALVASEDGALDAGAAQAKQRPVICSCRAASMPARSTARTRASSRCAKLLDGQAPRRARSKQDGSSSCRCSTSTATSASARWNRPNQRGPEEMGWRTTAQNLNLNRDYAKADAPEMQAMLRLLMAWDPLLYVDLHVTDGAKFEHDVVDHGRAGRMPATPRCARPARELRDDVIASAGGAGLTAARRSIPSFVENDDPTSGFEVGAPPPRFSTPATGRCATASGCSSRRTRWKDYPNARAKRRATRSSRCSTASRDRRPRPGRPRRARPTRRSGSSAASPSRSTSRPDRTRTHDRFPRLRLHAREPSAISGALMTRYDETTPADLDGAAARRRQALARRARAEGRLHCCPAAHAAWVGEKLAVHGIRTLPVSTSAVAKSRRGGLPRDRGRRSAAASYEGAPARDAEGRVGAARRATLPPARCSCPIAQPDGAPASMALLEPQAPDSLVAWGFVQRRLRAEGIHGGLRRRGASRERCSPTDPALARRVRQAARRRCRPSPRTRCSGSTSSTAAALLGRAQGRRADPARGHLVGERQARCARGVA